MRRLYLYTAFHANLFYSSVPTEDEDTIIDRCYWPLLQLVERFGLPIGLELTGYTLERLAQRDPTFVGTLRDLAARGLVEVLGSGYSQTIFPLIPAAANRANLEHGNEVYRRLLGRVPAVAYVNEQTYSRGLIEVYRGAGYRALLMDWNNPAKFNRYPDELQYLPQRLAGSGRRALRVLWNHSISFQKFQRYVFGELTLPAFLGYLHERRARTRDRAFALYGSDLEIFDYQPGRRPLGKNDRQAFSRIEALFAALRRERGLTVATPSHVLASFPSGRLVSLESPAYPIPCKKQDKYNLTRWAVTGQRDTELNTTSWRLQRKLEDLVWLNDERPASLPLETRRELSRALTHLWASDFRTFATRQKLTGFDAQAGSAERQLDALLGAAGGSLLGTTDVAFFNPHAQAWAGEPVAWRVEFQAGQFAHPPALAVGRRTVPTQFEEVERYHDGSIRSATVAGRLRLPPGGVARGRWIRARQAPAGEERASSLVTTPHVRLELNPRRGATIRSLAFHRFGRQPMAGHVPHGYFDDITLSPDFYTGHVILVGPDGKQLTDLSPAVVRVGSTAAHPIRIPVQVSLATELGEIRKTYWVYRGVPRVDLRYQFDLRPIAPRSFRLGIVTVLPGAFERRSLHYATVNGGSDVEVFPLAGATVRQHEPVSMAVSARQCLGESEGWVTLADRHRSLSVISWKETLYSVPLLHYEEPAPGQYFLRLKTTITETDDTPGPVWWGPLEKRFSYLGGGGWSPAHLAATRRIAGGLRAVTRTSEGSVRVQLAT